MGHMHLVLIVSQRMTIFSARPLDLLAFSNDNSNRYE
jgi:hypothetical protein